jgi:hypothetical protein
MKYNNRTNFIAFCLVIVVGMTGFVIFQATFYLKPVIASVQTSEISGNVTTSSESLQSKDSNATNSFDSMTNVNGTNGNLETSSDGYQYIRDSYLQQWDQLSFGSSLDTFITGDIGPDDIRYGYYDARPSSSFSPESEITLYIQPVGYKFGEAVDPKGNILNLVNVTSYLQVTNEAGEIMLELDFETPPFTSSEKRTESFYTLPVRFGQDTGPLPLGDYNFKYKFIDGVGGESFEIDKEVKIVQSIG